MTQEFRSRLLEIMGRHQGGLVAEQILEKALIKYSIKDLNHLEEKEQMVFVDNLIFDCYEDMVSREKLSSIQQSFFQALFNKDYEPIANRKLRSDRFWLSKKPKFTKKLLDALSQHLGGLIAQQVLSRQMIAFGIEDLDDLSDDTKRLFVHSIATDCYKDMVSKDKLESIQLDLMAKLFEIKDIKKITKGNEPTQISSKSIRRGLAIKEDRRQIVDNIKSNEFQGLTMLRKEDVDRANMLKVLRKSSLKEDMFELDATASSIGRGIAAKSEQEQEIAPNFIFALAPFLLIIMSLLLFLLSRFNSFASNYLDYVIIFTFTIAIIWAIMNTIKRVVK